MRIEYELNKDDLRQGVLHVLTHGPTSNVLESIRKQVRVRQAIGFSVAFTILVGWAIILPTLGMYFADDHQLALFISFAIAIGFAFWALRLQAIIRQPEATLNKHADHYMDSPRFEYFYGENSMELSEGGLLQCDLSSSSKIDWKAISGIDSTDRYLFIFVYGDAVFTIPRNSIGEPQQIEAFCEMAERFSGHKIRIIPA